eukprot:gnl/TRDRNA2_/TRDRNA2_85880_c0_seq1.p1 gnl/TRDRNA2_/TRDRNA2_85880_c0~~gnl/TRDRNA2_/TRDRNA2_85880_c0_seq1.p1  ORF type:complete len:687 (-),score=121.68 gnl/TRDRNA2_/TRDRNA2_85880_c0_seq1:92-2131(-)
MGSPPLQHIDVLVQFVSEEDAERTIEVCDGLSNDDGTGLIKVEFSGLQEIQIMKGNALCRDYTSTVSTPAARAPVPAAMRVTTTLPKVSHRVMMVHVRHLREPQKAPVAGLSATRIREAFSGFGAIVEKVVCAGLPGDGSGPLTQVDALVQFSSLEEASRMLQGMQGASLSGDSFHMVEMETTEMSEIVVPPGSGETGGDWTSGQSRAAGGMPAASAPSAAGAPAMPSTPAKILLGGKRVVVANITKLAKPNQSPLAGLTADAIHRALSPAGAIERIVCSTNPSSGPPYESIIAKVQFASVDSAAYVVESWQGLALTSDGMHVMHMSYDDVQMELVVMASSDSAYTNGKETTQAAKVVMPPAQAASGDMGRKVVGQAAGGDSEKKVIMVSVANLNRPDLLPLGGLKVNMVNQAFARFGAIRKIACYPVPGMQKGTLKQVNILVQFESGSSASQAMKAMSGISLTGDGFHQVKIEQSSLKDVIVKQNDDQTWDYTLQASDTAEGFKAPEAGAGFAATGKGGGIAQVQMPSMLPGQTPKSPSPAGLAPVLSPNGGGAGSVIAAKVSNLTNRLQAPLGGLTLSVLHEFFSRSGQIRKLLCTATPVHGPPLVSISVLVQYETKQSASSAVGSLNQTSVTDDGSNTVSMTAIMVPDINVKTNGPTSWDYTLPGASTGPPSTAFG